MAHVYDMKEYSQWGRDCIIPHKCEEGEIQMFNIENNYWGRTFLAMIRLALNRKTYDIRVRGSQSDRTAYRNKGIYLSNQSVPLKYADRLRIYISPKRNY